MSRTLLTVTLVWALLNIGLAAEPISPIERQRLTSHLDMTQRWLVDEVSTLSPAQLNFRPAAGAWTILEVLDHLVVVAPIYWQDLQNALKTPGGQTSPSTDADILWYGIDRTHREQAIPTEVPKGLRDLRRGLEEYRKLRARLREYINTTNDDLRGHIVARQRCDAYQWALLISTHEQRHVLQIRDVKADPNFPRK
jgi:uncharacterized damage-inducible protein DinB